MIRRFPGIGREVAPGVRKIKLRRFSYVIIYRVLEEHIQVESVFHTRRDPEIWRRRIQTDD